MSDESAAAENVRVGLVGLGIMGSAMTTNLLAAGFEVTGFDIVTEKVDDLVVFDPQQYVNSLFGN